MKTITSSLIMLVCLWCAHQAHAQESKFKALFIYKFSEYVEWPSNPDKIVVGVAGKTDVYDHLAEFAASKTNLSVIPISTPQQAKECHIVFLSDEESKALEGYKAGIGSGSTLLVTNKDTHVSKGADIGFYLEEGKLRFLINPASIKSKQMMASSKLLALGTSI